MEPSSKTPDGLDLTRFPFKGRRHPTAQASTGGMKPRPQARHAAKKHMRAKSLHFVKPPCPVEVPRVEPPRSIEPPRAVAAKPRPTAAAAAQDHMTGPASRTRSKTASSSHRHFIALPPTKKRGGLSINNDGAELPVAGAGKSVGIGGDSVDGSVERARIIPISRDRRSGGIAESDDSDSDW